MSYAADAVLWLHIATGAGALLLGVFNLLFTRKGARLHVLTGRMFWYSMLAMAITGVVVAIERPKAGFVLIGVLSMYLVNTGRNALRRPGGTVNADSRFWFAVATGCLLAGMALGSYALTRGGWLFGSPAALYFGAAFDAAIFVVLDWRLIRAGSATGTKRIVDHLWRMIAALLFAMFALFIANPSVFPGWFRSAGLNFLPPFLVLAAIAYWVSAVNRGWWRRGGVQ